MVGRDGLSKAGGTVVPFWEIYLKLTYTRWAPTSYKYYQWPYKCVSRVITLPIGVITPFITGRGLSCTQTHQCGWFIGRTKAAG